MADDTVADDTVADDTVADDTTDEEPTGFRKGRFVRALACDRQVRVLVAVADGPARELCSRHGLSGSAAVLASEGLVASVLLSSQVKGEERITIDVQSEAPPFSLTADIWAEGRLRGRFRPQDLPEGSHRSIRGFLRAVRSLHGKERYKGIAPIEDEPFEDALARFLTASEQVDGRVRIHVELDQAGRPAFAAGMLVERFPDLDPAEFAALFDHPMQDDFRALMTGFAFGQLGGHPVEVLESRPLEFRCTCSQERVVGMLRALGPDEVRSMLEEDRGAEVTCHYCNAVYTLDEGHLASILVELGATG